MLDMNAPQPQPKGNDARPVWESVVEDMKARDHAGRQKYGTPLQPHNGRNFLVDAYQEVLDLAVYLRGRIEEENETRSVCEAYERWEYDLVMSNEAWKGDPDALPTLTVPLYQELVRIQGLRNRALGRNIG